MSIAFRAEAHGSFSGTTSPIASAPSGLTDGDLIIVHFACSSNAVVNTVISGWTQLGSTQDQSTDTSSIWLYKIASSEGSSWTFTDLFTDTEAGVYGVVCYSGVDNTNPIDVTPVQGSFNYSTDMAAGPITPTNNNCMLVSVYGADPGSATRNATPDSTLPCTERIDTTEGGTAGYVYIQDHLQTTATAETHHATADANDGFAWMIAALRESTGGGGAISGTSDGTSNVTGALVGSGRLYGAISGTSLASGAVVATGELVGANGGTCVVTATVSGLGDLVGQGDGSCNVTATISGLGDLTGQSDGLAIVAGTIINATPTGEMSGVSEGTSVLSGTLTGYGELTGAIECVATVTGTMRDAGNVFDGVLEIVLTSGLPSVTITSGLPTVLLVSDLPNVTLAEVE